MSSSVPLVSEVVLYGLMGLNVVAVGFLLWRAWRGGHLADLDAAGEVLFLDDDESQGVPP